MKQKTRVAKAFYEKRDIPRPQSEWWPQDAGELREALHDATRPRLLLGDGQHLRAPAIGGPTFDVIRTEQCRRIVSVDRESKLVRVECGMRWGELQVELAERGLSLERYRLYPTTATVGGLLSRFSAVHRELWDGDLRTGCVALTGATGAADSTDYRYLPAPRKASGPDLRWLFMGAEGAFGAILDATLVVSAPSEARLLTWKPERFGQAQAIVNDVWDLGIHPSWITWTSYKTTSDELLIALHGPARLVDIATATLLERHDVPCEVTANAEVAAKRAELEAAHPDRRALATSIRTVHTVFSTRDLAAALDSLPASVENVTIWTWTRHHAHAYVRYARGKTLSDLPARVASRALDIRPILDDEAIHWSHSSRELKLALDPQRALAVGPS